MWRSLAWAGLFLMLSAPPLRQAAAQSGSLAGTYDGGQMEMAAGLELKADGRFNYALSYGALDEQAAGTWAVSGDRVLLTSSPVVAPRFVMLSRGRGPEGVLQIGLDVARGVSRQYFNALITRANGQTERQQLSDDGLMSPFTRANTPTSVRLTLQVFNIASDPVPLDPATGYALHFRFEPNDVGKVAFRAEPLQIAGGELVLQRHGRTIRFRRSRQ